MAVEYYRLNLREWYEFVSPAPCSPKYCMKMLSLVVLIMPSVRIGGSVGSTSCGRNFSSEINVRALAEASGAANAVIGPAVMHV